MDFITYPNQTVIGRFRWNLMVPFKVKTHILSYVLRENIHSPLSLYNRFSCTNLLSRFNYNSSGNSIFSTIHSFATTFALKWMKLASACCTGTTVGGEERYRIWCNYCEILGVYRFWQQVRRICSRRNRNRIPYLLKVNSESNKTCTVMLM